MFIFHICIHHLLRCRAYRQQQKQQQQQQQLSGQQQEEVEGLQECSPPGERRGGGGGPGPIPDQSGEQYGAVTCTEGEGESTCNWHAYYTYDMI